MILRLLSRFRRHTRPVQEFLHTEAASGVILGIAAILAIVVANSPMSERYLELLDTRVVAGIGSLLIDKPLLLWINDGLMAVFFLLVGLEIKREIKYGQLSSFRSALLPMACAAGGALIPALIFAYLNPEAPASRGWAIPMATDIAFAVGVLALLGSRVPSWAKVLLLATAVVDDLIAVVVIALFYTEGVKVAALGVAVAMVFLAVVLNLVNTRAIWPYLLVGLVMWVAVLKSGVHATLAGVVLGFLVPAIPRKQQKLTESEQKLLIEMGQEASSDEQELRQQQLEKLEDLVIMKGSPLHRLEHKLHPLVAFLIMPLFAFANAGVQIDFGNLGSALTSPISIGIIAGLFIGKQLGIFTISLLFLSLGLVPLPKNRETLTWVYGLSLLAGIGFTMSLFIGGLAYDDPTRFEQAKMGILAGSLLSGVIGFTVLRLFTPSTPSAGSDTANTA